MHPVVLSFPLIVSRQIAGCGPRARTRRMRALSRLAARCSCGDRCRMQLRGNSCGSGSVPGYTNQVRPPNSPSRRT